MSKKKRIFPIMVASFQTRTDGGPMEMIVHDEYPSSFPQIYKFEEATNNNADGYCLGKVYSNGRIKPTSLAELKEETEYCVCLPKEQGDLVLLESFAPIDVDFGTALYRWFPRYKHAENGVANILFRIPSDGVEKYAVLDDAKYNDEILKAAKIKHLTENVICLSYITKTRSKYIFYNMRTGQLTPIDLAKEQDIIMNDEGSRIRIVKKDDLGTQRGFIIDKESAELLRKYFDNERNLNMYN